MTKEESIKDTLEVIKRALEDDNPKNINDSILILNRKVNNDGTFLITKHIRANWTYSSSVQPPKRGFTS